MRHVLAAVLLVSAVSAVAAPPQPEPEVIERAREQFAYYLASGWTAEEIAAGLSRYYGQVVEVREHRGARDVVIVRRDPKTGDVTYLVVAGTIPASDAP